MHGRGQCAVKQSWNFWLCAPDVGALPAQNSPHSWCAGVSAGGVHTGWAVSCKLTPELSTMGFPAQLSPQLCLALSGLMSVQLEVPRARGGLPPRSPVSWECPAHQAQGVQDSSCLLCSGKIIWGSLFHSETTVEP